MSIKQLNKEIKIIYKDIEKITNTKHFYMIWIKIPLINDDWIYEYQIEADLKRLTEKDMKFLTVTIFKNQLCLNYEVI